MRPAAACGAANSLQLIAFSIGEQTYGVEITTVREIRAWNGATPLPNTREFVRGVINLRGTIVPIFDLRARFGEGPTSPTKNHVVVVMSVGDKWVGILVDAVIGHSDRRQGRHPQRARGQLDRHRTAQRHRHP